MTGEGAFASPAPEPLPRRIFVVGCPRSGTTLLQSLLAAHPAVLSFPESDVFAHLEPKHRLHRALDLARPKGRRRLAEFLRRIEPGAAPPSPRTVRGCDRVLGRALDRAARRHGACAWLEKTPRHLHSIPRLERAFGGARFVHVLRRGEDTVPSLYDVLQRHPGTFGRLRDLDGCIARWLGDVAISRAQLGRPEHLLVRYEALAAAPRSALERVCAFLELPFDPAMLKGRSEEARRLVLDGEVWKADATGPLRPAASKLEALFDGATRRRIRSAVARAELEAWLPLEHPGR